MTTKQRFLFSTLLKGLVRLAVAAGLIAGAVAGYRYLLATKPEIEAQPRQEKIYTVLASPVLLADARPVNTAFGKVEASRHAMLHFPIAGEVDKVSDKLQNGSQINAGEILARLDTTLMRLDRDNIAVQIEAEKANLAELATQHRLRENKIVSEEKTITELEKQLTLQKSINARIEQMSAARVASDRALDESRLAVSAASTALQSARARLDDARLSLSIARNAETQAMARLEQLRIQLRRVERMLDDAILIAPFDGSLTDVNIGLGQIVDSRTAIARITDLSSLEVGFIVPAEVFATAETLVGEPVTITWKAGGRDVLQQSAIIQRAEGRVNAAEGGGKLYAVLPGITAGTEMIPDGAFVEIAYAAGQISDIAELPEEALNGNETVFVITDGRAEARQIRIHHRTPGKIFVSGDLANGESVIATRLPGLGNGTRVKVRQ